MTIRPKSYSLVGQNRTQPPAGERLLLLFALRLELASSYQFVPVYGCLCLPGNSGIHVGLRISIAHLTVHLVVTHGLDIEQKNLSSKQSPAMSP
ncbi:hypothetical protein PGTUg99_027439 [Puccinia graminis f. sp. tritici]|uniref:Uncharacterized protein n=1 Tax=Puccinia graminis f. sp. tritici TaxID=56615 RepID=A0A5B0NMK5_PUCGR|nr:hypothetical protein PGTUg99_027439 [Puccinia graminis f. sp. tritici]